MGLVIVPAALGQAEPVSPQPPKPVLPPRTVQPKPPGKGATAPKRLPVDINHLLKSRAGYKTARSLSGQFMAYGPISPKRRGG
ncbi:MAG TPA: hypothetical protein EYG44_03885, partial [Verrucomicrobia bacterium]|nr:hypothetical protein [Verrucomicrobiota bacterium]